MENQIWFDSSLFLHSIALGFLFGLFYELFRFLRLAFPHSDLAVAAEDFIFFLPVTAVFILFSYAFSDGIIRWFSVGAAMLGAFLYFQTLGKILLFFSDTILRLIKVCLRFVFGKTVLPVWNIFKKITKCLYTRIILIGIIIKENIVRRRLRKEKERILRAARRGFGC